MAYVSPYPRSLAQPLRRNKLMVGAGFRGYFAPYNAALGSGSTDSTQGPTIINLASGPFTHSALLALGFFDVGWIKDFKTTPETKIGQVRSGYRGAVRAQYRGQVGETFELKFNEYGRLQYKLSTGTNVLNLLSGGTPSTNSPLNVTGADSVALTAYLASDPAESNSPTLDVASVSGFAVGDIVVADVDYDPATYGIIGDAGTPVFRSAVTNVDYIRMNSDYVGRVVSISGTKLVLDQPLCGGGSGNPTGYTTPQAGSKVQKVAGFCAREGGTYISEWTGLFLLDSVDIAQVAFYYPHLSIMQNRDTVGAFAIENIGTTDLGGHQLDAQFQALAFDDPVDGETAVCYRCLFPPPGASSNAAY